ncbi:hypothetical protein, partial [Klebsiella variicola]|uniref:hypothetical protein n=1 Tax=Klebsiella variicola TaxID=244366 RepID=UPI0039C20416
PHPRARAAKTMPHTRDKRLEACVVAQEVLRGSSSCQRATRDEIPNLLDLIPSNGMQNRNPIVAQG